MWTQNRLYSNSWWLITQLRKGPTWRNEHIWAAIVPCLLSSFLRLFCTVLLDCMWHAWLMRHYQKVSQANNFRRGQKSSKANKNPCILAGKQWRQTGRQAGRKVAYGAFALSLAEVVKISLILLLPCSVLDCVLVSLFTFVLMCVCVSLMKRLAFRAAPYCLQNMQSQARRLPDLPSCLLACYCPFHAVIYCDPFPSAWNHTHAEERIQKYIKLPPFNSEAFSMHSLWAACMRVCVNSCRCVCARQVFVTLALFWVIAHILHTRFPRWVTASHCRKYASIEMTL